MPLPWQYVAMNVGAELLKEQHDFTFDLLFVCFLFNFIENVKGDVSVIVYLLFFLDFFPHLMWKYWTIIDEIWLADYTNDQQIIFQVKYRTSDSIFSNK